MGGRGEDNVCLVEMSASVDAAQRTFCTLGQRFLKRLLGLNAESETYHFA